jgi:hypothetical protein
MIQIQVGEAEHLQVGKSRLYIVKTHSTSSARKAFVNITR